MGKTLPNCPLFVFLFLARLPQRTPYPSSSLGKGATGQRLCFACTSSPHTPALSTAGLPAPTTPLPKSTGPSQLLTVAPNFLGLFSLNLLRASGSVDPLLPSRNSSDFSDSPLLVFTPPPWLLLLYRTLLCLLSLSALGLCLLSPRHYVLSLGDRALSLASGVFGRQITPHLRSLFIAAVSWMGG